MKKAIHKDKPITTRKIVVDILIGALSAGILEIVRLIFKSAPQTGRTIWATINNTIYSCAANMSSNYVLSLVFEILFFIMITFYLVPIITFIYDAKNKKKSDKLEEYENRINRIEANTEFNISSLTNSKNEIDEIQKELKAYKMKYTTNEKSKRKTVSITVAVVFLLIFIVSAIISVFIPLNLLNSFNHDIQMIKPYTDSSTIIKIESDWARMKTKNDYVTLYETINKIKDRNSLR